MQLLLLILGITISILTFSGYGETLGLNEKLMYLGWGVSIFCYLIKRNELTFKIGKISYLISLSCILILINILSHYRSYTQLLNFTTLFGIVIGTAILSKVKWNESEFLRYGIIVWAASWVLIQLFLPGRVLSGWNDNSAIFLIPAVTCGLGLIYQSKLNYKIYIFYGCLLLTVSTILTLENRSSILALIVFGVIAYPKFFKYSQKKSIFRILYMSVLLLNVCMPLFNDFIGQLDIYNNIMSASQEYVNKAGGFSDRDVRWNIAIYELSQNPILGNGGIRTIYYHNFSCDVLTQFGWLGFATFSAMYCLIMEKCFAKDGYSNIFLIAFACLLVLNTFENTLFADNCFTIFPYFLFAIAWQMKCTTSAV